MNLYFRYTVGARSVKDAIETVRRNRDRQIGSHNELGMYTGYGAADIPFEKPTEGRDAISPEAYTEFNAMLMDAKRAGVHLMLFISPSFNSHLLRSKKILLDLAFAGTRFPL